MSSKWLRWPIGHKTIANVPDPEPAKPPKIISEGFAGSIPATLPIIHDKRQYVGPNPESKEPVPRNEIIESVPSPEPAETAASVPTSVCGAYRDKYDRRVQLALEAICQIRATDGLIVWLADHSPDLYQRLTSDLPDRISRAWDDCIPYDEFDAICCDLVDTFRRAADLRLVRE
jgi:hypothetical protein